MAHYLVTGGCGFIGSHVAEQLTEAGHTVRILDDLSTGHRENAPASSEIIVGDIAALDTVKQAFDGVDGCFHLAAIASVARSNEDWLGTHRVNLTGTINIFEAARQQKRPVVYASSAAIYGDNPNIPLTEDSETRPMTAYGADKLGCELHARVAALVHQTPSVGFRFFNVYGPRQDPKSPYSGVISIFADRIRAGQDIGIHGDGEQFRDFVYVGDVVKYLLAAMDKANLDAPVFNICTGRRTSINELAATLSKVAGRDVNISHSEARVGDIRESLGSPDKVSAFFGFSATTELTTGLAATLSM